VNHLPKFHPYAEIFPLLEGEEFAQLVADIKANGQHEPVVIYQDQILDGRNRYRACIAAGVDCCSIPYTGSDPVGYVVSKNILRRHLRPEKRNEAIVELLKLNPHKSDRQIAKEIGVDHKTIGAVRRKAEDVGSIPHAEIRTDSKGRKQPAKKAAYVEEEPTSDIGSPSVRYSEAPTTSVPPKSRHGSVSAKDIALEDFSARAMELVRLTKKNNTERFANTSLSFKDLRALGHFFLDLANVCEKKRKVEIDAKREAEVAAILGEAAP
jgi:ParB-like chromosome segregation protein Spo0J